MRAIREKINQERIKAIKLRNQAFEEDITNNQISKLRKEQQKAYDKFVFFKKLNEAVNKQNKEEI